MKLLEGPDFDPYRVPIPKVLLRLNPGVKPDERNGAFVFVLGAARLRVVAANGGGWDHVSISLEDRCPTWAEMEWIKRRFFKRSEVAMQLHVTADEHVNVHPNCLHLWRPHKLKIPLPPSIYV